MTVATTYSPRLTDIMSASSAPFGAPHPAAMSASGLTGWIFAEQAAFYRSLSSFIRAAKDDGSAMWGLFGISFLYGVFHAVGPGHGKAVALRSALRAYLKLEPRDRLESHEARALSKAASAYPLLAFASTTGVELRAEDEATRHAFSSLASLTQYVAQKRAPG